MCWQPHNSPQSVMELVVIDSSYLKFYSKGRERRRAIDVRCKRVEKLWALRENGKLSTICSPDEEKETREAKRAASLHSADIARTRCEEAQQNEATNIKEKREEINARTKIVFCNTSGGKM